jgi:hypothetical protein
VHAREAILIASRNFVLEQTNQPTSFPGSSLDEKEEPGNEIDKSTSDIAGYEA